MTDEETGARPSEGAELLHVRLPVFDGPLDLLLHLVRKHQLDINDLRLAELTEPYLAHLERMQALNLDVAGEFLQIAATLVWIKSRSLLPREITPEEPDPAEQEALLIERLQEYQKIKDAAMELVDLDLLGRDRFARQPPAHDRDPPREAAPVEPVSLYALMEAFREVLERARETPPLEVAPPSEPIEERIDRLLERFAGGGPVAFEELFEPEAGRTECVLAFIALLELVRLRVLRLAQGAGGGDILCVPTERFGASVEEWKASLLHALGGGGEDAAAPGR